MSPPADQATPWIGRNGRLSQLFVPGLIAAAVNAAVVLWLSASSGIFYLMPAGKLYLAIIGGAAVLALGARLVGWRAVSGFLAMLQFGPLFWCMGMFAYLTARL